MTDERSVTPDTAVTPATGHGAPQQAAGTAAEYLLRLYVAGTSPQSTRAILNIQAICEQHLKGRYQLDVIDIYQRPQLAKEEQIIAVPTLVKRLPEPLRRVIGSFSDSERVLIGLDLACGSNRGRDSRLPDV